VSLLKTATLTRILSILTIWLLACLTSYSQKKSNQKTIIQTLEVAYLEGCETGKGACKPVEILRQTKQDSILLVFPSGWTESHVYLRSATDKRIELHDRRKAGQGEPTLDLTKLDDGEYTAGIASCGLGGSCKIMLKTKVE
jgi:hypothetical protein